MRKFNIDSNVKLDLSLFTPDALFFFDFDGVIADNYEESIYDSEPYAGERRILNELAGKHNYDETLYKDTKRLRHIINQSVLFQEKQEIRPHEAMLDTIRELEARHTPYFIITARSSFYAVGRMIDFLRKHDLRPYQTLCLDSGSKGTALVEFRRFWPHTEFVFIDDKQYNIDDARWQCADPLTTVKVDWPSQSLP